MNSSYADSFSIQSYLNRQPSPLFTRTAQFRKRGLGKSLEQTWDRVKVLGDNREYGHAGCVNALQWAREGELLLSAGDDTTVLIWRMDSTEMEEAYPFVCRTAIHTGHTGNIFNAQMLPYSSRIATVAADRQVRIFDQEYCTLHSRTHTLRCHEDRVKRIATEESPDRFLTVSEDGSVRQHDLRVRHTCRTGCPAPIIQVRHELSALATSSFYCVVAGDSPYGYLFDRRFTGRDLQDEWGMKADGLTTCVRRFGRGNYPRTSNRRRYYGEHITGARISSENGHEVLLSYSSDGVYLFSILDDLESGDTPTSNIVSPNSKRRKVDDLMPSSSNTEESGEGMEIDELLTRLQEEQEEEDEDIDESPSEEPEALYPRVPVVNPRRRYTGARNVETVKDVNFLGPRDEFVTSGSDDGNFFVWHKSTSKLHGIYEGDGAVVNVVEGHPKLPLIAVSGIDHTVKLFAPTTGESQYSRMSIAESIMQRNLHRSHLRKRMYIIPNLEKDSPQYTLDETLILSDKFGFVD
ncbi:WD40 repeat-like protein [Gymnopus androsaceus JB14]|uniref:WD40 repeat-like protein n=1 Tax=Gymnopus androsaceus JB14 TaxID=1447944 RepID=A0A6A4IJA6_9AGAR|nr:WD40 repeat-like protein [Gymnopus androsaceus JB14]